MSRKAEPPPLAPPFPWPGGKRRLVESLAGEVPETYGTYFEPFVGSAALFFYLRPRHAVLSDHNAELITFFEVLRDNPGGLIEGVGRLNADQRTYNAVRRHRPVDRTEVAVRFLYLTTLAFNGIYRVNRLGRFNTPFGHRSYKSLRELDWLRATSEALVGVEFEVGDFRKVTTRAVEGDVVYFDPPYTVAHQNNGFVRYNEKLFSMDDQVDLATLARDLADRGVHVVISNACHPSILTLYEGFKVVEVERRSSMAADSAMRGPVRELILVAPRKER